MKKSVCLIEYTSTVIAQYRLSDEERDYLTRLAYIKSENVREQRFYFDELTTDLKILTLSWVGVVELATVRITIQPKFNNGFESLIDISIEVLVKQLAKAELEQMTLLLVDPKG